MNVNLLSRSINGTKEECMFFTREPRKKFLLKNLKIQANIYVL